MWCPSTSVSLTAWRATPGTGGTSRRHSFITRSRDVQCVDLVQARMQRPAPPTRPGIASCHSGCCPSCCIIVVTVMVDVSCAAISRKIMWLTTSSSLNRWPSSVSMWHRAENRSVPVDRARAGMCRRKNSSSTRRPRRPRCHLVPGTSARTNPSPAWTQSMKAWFTRASSSASATSAPPMKICVARSRVRSFSAGIGPELPVGGPAVEPGRDGRTQGRRVVGDAVAGERLLQDPAMVMVLLEVQQHQAAVEERADQVAPAAGVGERLVGVAQRDLARVRARAASSRAGRRSCSRTPGRSGRSDSARCRAGRGSTRGSPRRTG